MSFLMMTTFILKLLNNVTLIYLIFFSKKSFSINIRKLFINKIVDEMGKKSCRWNGLIKEISGQWKISTRKLKHERADVTLELERTLLTSPSPSPSHPHTLTPSPSPSLTLTLTPSHPHPHTRTLICTLVLKFPRA